MRAGFDHHLTKSADPAQLADLIEKTPGGQWSARCVGSSVPAPRWHRLRRVGAPSTATFKWNARMTARATPRRNHHIAVAV